MAISPAFVDSTISNYLSFASEVSELESLLADLPDANVIERMSLESRLESARVEVARLKAQTWSALLIQSGEA